VQNLASAADRFAKQVAAGRGVDEPHAVAIHGPEQHDEAGEFHERLALRLGAGAEVQRGRILEHHQEGDLAFLDEFLAVGLAEPRGDVPVDVAHVVAEAVFHDLVELHAPSAKGGTVFAA
jgi:hypothetical protein